MGDHHLPDELLSEILSPALKVTDDAFSDISDASPFASYSESTSAYLLVSKSWLRVATPLLYHVVVLRSKGQAAALGRALSQNEDLGRFIKKLRVEGGYGQPMHTILSRTPNVTDLYLYLDIMSSDSTVGLCKGLCLVNPTRLIVKDDTEKPPSNKMAVNLFSALGAAIRKWEQLVVFECTYVYTYQWEQRGAPLVEAFVEVQRLHTLVVDFAYQLDAAYKQLKACSLRTVRVKQKLQIWDDPICEDASLLAILEYKPRDLVAAVEDAALPSEFGSYPLENVSQDVQEAIWSRVSQFAFDQASHDQKIPFLLVSQTFYKAGFANCFETTLLHSQSEAQGLLTLLENHPDLISTFRSLAIVLWSRYQGDEDWRAEYASLITTVGASLRTLCATTSYSDITAASRLSPDMFLCLNNLRTLEWGFRTKFAAENMPSIFKFENALPQLECLILTNAEQSFLEAFSYASLPSLHTVKLAETWPGEVLDADDFLIAHGHKLRDLKVTFAIVVETDGDACPSMRLSRGILELCPLLVDLVFMEAYSPPPPEVLACTSTRSAIEKISFTWSRIKFRDVLKNKSRATQWETFFSTTPDPGHSLPHLREIRLVSIAWPINERDIAKNFWVGAAEKLLARTSGYASASERVSAIQTTDGSGKAWRPRLKAGPSRKRS
ncbi:hypothetical protein C8F01DRAFT_1233863 [Mycena amicta]|nr:hypothetical protein C8F01DRAFT_1233863 [Mycena amicta]